MKVHRYGKHQRKQWVLEMRGKHKTVKQICEEAAISRATLYIWLKEFAGDFAGTETGDSILPKQTNTQILWEPQDAHKMLLAALGKIDTDKTTTKKIVSELVKRYTLTIAQACLLAGITEEAYGYKPRKPEAEDHLVYEEIVRLLAEDGTRGLDECTNILQETKPTWPRKQIKRIYRQGRLYLKRTRARAARVAVALQTPLPTAINLPKINVVTWQVGIVVNEDATGSGLLYAIDYEEGIILHSGNCNAELQAEELITFLSTIATQYGSPKKVRMVAQPPFNSRETARWAWDNKVALYKLSMSKPENQLEIGYLEEKIKRQLLKRTLEQV